MLLSVVIYNHKLTAGQRAGAGIVFAGISVEAWVKRKGEKIINLPLFMRGGLTVLFRDPRKTRCAREREGED